MSYTKDMSIVAQVAAKIAGDLTVATNGGVVEWIDNYEAVRDQLFKDHGFTATQATHAVLARAQQAYTQSQAEQAITREFNAQPVGVTVKGDQHGPLPTWFVEAAASAGVTEVWDNRDKLAENAKRPWFKEVGGNEKPFWPPKK